MVNRHHLRVKALHALYAYFSTDDNDIARGDKELFKSIDKVYELYIKQLSLLQEILHIAERSVDDNKLKHRPTSDDLKPNLKFVENRVLNLLTKNAELNHKRSEKKVNWQTDSDLVKRILNNIKNSDEYKNYMSSTQSSFREDQKFVADIYANYIAEDDLLLNFYDEQSVHWTDDFYLVNTAVIKTIESLKETSNEGFRLLSLYKDAEDDKNFVKDLFRKTALNNVEFEELIGKKTQNWEVDRIASMDILIMKMALTELLNFNSIPIKVSLNEYIELSKEYSTPKSKIFVNGILDKLVADLKRENRIVKVGRGLME